MTGCRTIDMKPGRLRMKVSAAGFSTNFLREKKNATAITWPLNVNDAHGMIAKATQRMGISFLQVMIMALCVAEFRLFQFRNWDSDSIKVGIANPLLEEGKRTIYLGILWAIGAQAACDCIDLCGEIIGGKAGGGAFWRIFQVNGEVLILWQAMSRRSRGM